jgi:hypothetical protein
MRIWSQEGLRDEMQCSVYAGLPTVRITEKSRLRATSTMLITVDMGCIFASEGSSVDLCV